MNTHLENEKLCTIIPDGFNQPNHSKKTFPTIDLHGIWPTQTSFCMNTIKPSFSIYICIKHTAMSFYFDHHNLLIILFMWNCNPIITLITQSHRNIINCDVFTFCLNNSKYVTSKLQYTKTSCDFIVKCFPFE